MSRSGLPWLRALLVWVLIVAAESVHGTLRSWYLAPLVGDFRARQISVFTGTLIIFLIAWSSSRWLRADSTRSLLAVGLVWVALTVLFEIGLGRFVMGYNWERMISDYNLSRGGLLGLGLAAMLFMPLLAARLRGVKDSIR